MQVLTELSRRWRRRRRLTAIHRQLRACAADPDRLAEAGRRLGIAPSLLEGWLAAVEEPWPEEGDGPTASSLRLAPTRLTEGATLSPRARRGGRALHQPTSPSLDERTRRMILLLLDLPVARDDPARASDFVVHLAEAAARRDEELVDALGAALFEAQRQWVESPADLRRAGPPPAVETARPEEAAAGAAAKRAPSVSWAEEELAAVGPPPVAAMRFPEIRSEYRPLASSVAPGATAVAAEISAVPDAVPPVDEEAEEDGPALRALLESVCGDPALTGRLESELAYLDSLRRETGAAEEPPQGGAELLAVVRTHLERVVADLAGRSRLSRWLVLQALNGVALRAATSFDDLRWFLAQGDALGGGSRTGAALPAGAEVAWNLLCRTALLRLPYALQGEGPKIEWLAGGPRGGLEALLAEVPAGKRASFSSDWMHPHPEEELRVDQKAGSTEAEVAWLQKARVTRQARLLLESLAARLISERIDLAAQRAPILRRDATAAGVGEDAAPAATPWPHLLRRLIGQPSIAADPALAVQLAGEVCRNRGTLTWEACLMLANSRAGFHRFLDGETAATWQILADLRPADDGSLQVPFAVVEQPLSPRFRRRFEGEGLRGRVTILDHLVRYAAEPRASLLSITVADAGRQLARREEELWQTMAGTSREGPDR